MKVPARKIKPNRRSMTGQVALRGGKSEPFESSLERDFLILLDFDPTVREISTQPVRIEYQNKNSALRSYTPFAEMSYRQHRTDFPNLTESAYREWLLREVVKPDNNTFIHVPWMSGIKYLNSDGAHRFGAAWVSNLMESANTRIICKFVKYDFNTAWLSQLFEYCHAYVVTFETEEDLARFEKAFDVYSECRMAWVINLYRSPTNDLVGFRYKNPISVIIMFPVRLRISQIIKEHISQCEKMNVWKPLPRVISQISGVT